MWAAGLYLAVQQIESNLISPLIQREMVKVPPALFLLSAVAMGALFGVPGIILAGPLTVTVFVLVRTLYVEEALGEPLGQEKGNR
ncbi:AI-2E family transporter [Roseibium salinum]|nr:AI-2E family transporter [Roseibium salinum]